MQSFLSLLISQPASSSSFPPPPFPWAAEKLSLMRTLWGSERWSGPTGSCSSSSERLPFKHTHLLTNTNNGLYGCQFSELYTLTPLPPLNPLADIKKTSIYPCWQTVQRPQRGWPAQGVLNPLLSDGELAGWMGRNAEVKLNWIGVLLNCLICLIFV